MNWELGSFSLFVLLFKLAKEAQYGEDGSGLFLLDALGLTFVRLISVQQNFLFLFLIYFEEKFIFVGST